MSSLTTNTHASTMDGVEIIVTEAEGNVLWRCFYVDDYDRNTTRFGSRYV